jgi:hypothetical protein
VSEEDQLAQAEYEEAYYGMESDDESKEGSQDFH